MYTLRRVLYLIFRPRAEWDLIAVETTSVDLLLRRFILPLSALAPIATVIGMTTFDRAWDPVHGYQVPAEQILAAGAATFFASVASIFALAGIFALIAPMFGSTRDYRAALKVATYGAIPVQLAGVTLVLPVMAIVGVVGLCHTLYLYWVGVGRVLNVSPGSRSEFVGIAMIFLVAVSVTTGAVASALGLF